MRFIGLVFALLAALCLAQSTQPNYINVPVGNFDAVAGQPFTITWQNPSTSTVTIRLYQGGQAGPILISGIPASAQTATFTIPSDVNNAQYSFAIVDDSNPTSINYSSGFTIAGASASASASATATATASATASLSSLSSSASSVLSSLSASASSVSASLSSAVSSASHSASSSASKASSSAAAVTSVAASTNGCAMAFGVSGAAAVFAAALAVY